MGYYTKFELKIFDVKNLKRIKKLEEHEYGDSWSIVEKFRQSNDSALAAINNNGETRDECTWNTHKEDLKKLSKKYKNLLFQLYGEGEDRDDMWVRYFQNGKTQMCRAQITFDKFNPKRLS